MKRTSDPGQYKSQRAWHYISPRQKVKQLSESSQSLTKEYTGAFTSGSEHDTLVKELEAERLEVLHMMNEVKIMNKL